MTLAIGIDVHKASLVVAVHGGASWTVAPAPTPLAALVERLRGLRPTVIVLEPSGGYERPVLAALQDAQLPVARVNPREVRHFARAARIQAKSDRLDARVLAAFGATLPPSLTGAPAPARARLAGLTGRRRQVREMAAAEKRRRETATADAQASIARNLAFLADELSDLDRTIAALIETDPQFLRTRTLLCSVPGIGRTTAQLLVAELPELGTIDAKAIAALVGVAPFTQQSGASPGVAHIDGGRRHIRTGLWMPTLCAMTRNPVIRALRDRLAAASKPHKVIAIACLRKLLTSLNAMLAHDEPWNPRRQTA